MFHSDAAFAIGKSHAVCQDYAFADNDADNPCALLSDGCSGSEDTDVGARILVHTAKTMCRSLFQKPVDLSTRSDLDRIVRGFAIDCYTHARQLIERLGLPASSLDATLLGFVAPRYQADEPNGPVYGLAIGDGVLVLSYRDGRTGTYEFKYPSGYPLYPAYLADGERGEIWRANHSVQVVTYTQRSRDGSIATSHKTTYGAGEAMCAIAIDPIEVQFAAAFSDGIHSYQRRDEKNQLAPIPFDEALCDLLDFKVSQGVFAQRSLRWLEGELLGRRWQHYDDVSMAVMDFGDI